MHFGNLISNSKNNKDKTTESTIMPTIIGIPGLRFEIS
jgi:hypothetical protein